MFPLRAEIHRLNPEEESLVQPILDTLSDHIAILNDRGEIIAVNAAWRGLASEDMFARDNYGIGLAYVTVCQRSTVMNLPDAAQSALGIHDFIDGNSEHYQQEYPANSPPDRRWYLLRASRFNLHGETRILVAHQDISDLKDTQAKSGESQRPPQQLLDQKLEAVLAVTPQGRIENCDSAAERIFGYRRDELEGASITRILGDTRCRGDNLHEFNGNHGHALTGKRRNSDEFPVLFKFDSLKGKRNGQYTVSVQDVTERESMPSEKGQWQAEPVAQADNQERQRFNSQFLTMMAHELRTPLASIRLSYDMLTHYGKLATEDERIEYLDNISAQVEHLNEVVRDVMSLSKADRGELEFNPEHGDLTTFCHNIVESFQINHLHSHKVEFVCASAELFADFDRRLLRRALTNLLDNAIKYSPQGGNVRCRLSGELDGLRISVSDEGIGIPPDDAEYLFDAFHRASNVGSLPGTGLGLAIAKQAIERHGGTIVLLPQSGIGATFCIELPISTERQ